MNGAVIREVELAISDFDRAHGRLPDRVVVSPERFKELVYEINVEHTLYDCAGRYPESEVLVAGVPVVVARASGETDQ